MASHGDGVGPRVHRLGNRFRVPGFVINSLPKAGTHLLQKAMRLFPGLGASRVRIARGKFVQFSHQASVPAVMIPVGVDSPVWVPVDVVRRSLQRVRRGSFATKHGPFSEGLAGLLDEMGMKSLLILRDPRDVVVSHALYVAQKANHPAFAYYQRLSPSERIMTSIVGVERLSAHGPGLLSISARYESVLPWMSHPGTYTTYFEKLVGPRGGGTRAHQVKELTNIAEHLGLRYRREDIERIASRLFGGTHTFRRGMAGDWRGYLSAEHLAVFEELAGELLARLGYA